MKKNEFVSLVAERTDMSKKDTEKVIDAAFAAIGDLMMQGDKLVLSGFGSFETKVRTARSGRNPRTGEVIEIEQATLPVFKAGRTLKDKVNAK
ncbi:HU family DNA-binding protein [Agathobaculum sp.]|uniref:HU family DNA-binding protein n=1 Tax=Agathobaculum sp. TaxID=2048138 RepID=UPI003AB4CA9A